MRLAMVTPLDPRATGVADYSLDLLPYLAQIAPAEIFVYSNDPMQSGKDGYGILLITLRQKLVITI